MMTRLFQGHISQMTMVCRLDKINLLIYALMIILYIGGIDLYDREFESKPTHDDFYTKSEIINAFKNYISHVVPRYLKDPTILGWELGNDLRCSSTLKASSSCNTTTITKWVNDICPWHIWCTLRGQFLIYLVAGHIKTLDPDHLITAGYIFSLVLSHFSLTYVCSDGGFYCKDCSKLYANSSSLVNSPGGPTFDGSFGVDTEDILSVPCIDFGSLYVFSFIILTHC